jgi:hypothetical protein
LVLGTWYLARIKNSEKSKKKLFSHWPLAIGKCAQPCSLDWHLVLGMGQSEDQKQISQAKVPVHKIFNPLQARVPLPMQTKVGLVRGAACIPRSRGRLRSTNLSKKQFQPGATGMKGRPYGENRD